MAIRVITSHAIRQPPLPRPAQRVSQQRQAVNELANTIFLRVLSKITDQVKLSDLAQALRPAAGIDDPKIRMQVLSEVTEHLLESNEIEVSLKVVKASHRLKYFGRSHLQYIQFHEERFEQYVLQRVIEMQVKQGSLSEAVALAKGRPEDPDENWSQAEAFQQIHDLALEKISKTVDFIRALPDQRMRLKWLQMSVLHFWRNNDLPKVSQLMSYYERFDINPYLQFQALGEVLVREFLVELLANDFVIPLEFFPADADDNLFEIESQLLPILQQMQTLSEQMHLKRFSDNRSGLQEQILEKIHNERSIEGLTKLVGQFVSHLQ